VAVGTYYLGAIVDYANTVPETDETNNALAGNQIVISLSPDLIVTSVSSPVSGVTGSTIMVSHTVKNQGTGTASPSFSVGVFLSTDSTITTSDTMLGGRVISSLTAGAQSASDLQVTIPTSVAAGTYYIGVIADYGSGSGSVVESNETNNWLAGNQITVTPGADLIVTSVSGPVSGVTGSTITVSHAVKNQGTGTASPSFNVGVFLSTDSTITTSDTMLGGRVIGSLAAGAESAADVEVTIPTSVAAGTYYIGVIADYNSGTVPESDDTNNWLAGNQITVTVGADLVVTSVSGPVSGVTGSTITVSHTVKNQGTGTASPSFSVGVFLSTDSTITTSDTMLGGRVIGSLAAGAESAADVQVTIPTSVAPGTYYIGVIADYNSGTVPESDDTNNWLAGNQITVTVGADLVVTSVSGPVSGVTGSTITVSHTVKNQGTGTASPSFSVGVFLSTDTTITTSDISLGGRVIGSLAAGAESASDLQLTIPTNTASGIYYLGVIADYGSGNGTVPESNDTNNWLAGNQIYIGNDTTPPTGTITINNGVATTNNATVTLTLNALDSQSGIYRMQFSNDNQNWSSEEAYATTKTWNLDSIDGTKTVYVKFMDLVGNSSVYSGSITLDTTPPSVTISSPVSGVTSTNTPLLLYTVDEGTAVVTLDGTVITKASGDILDPLAEGTHILRVESNDTAGNFGYAEVSITFDINPPTTSLTTNPSSPDGLNGWFKIIPSITLSSNETGTIYYKWGAGRYSSTRQNQEWITGGTALNIRGDDSGAWYTLPFSFKFYDTEYTNIYLSSNGLLSFTAEDIAFYNEGFANKVAIAPLWDDLRTDTRTDDDIYVFQPDADSIGFRWKAVTWSDSRDTNFEVILHRDGTIRFNYGNQGGELSPTIGVSKGDGTNYSITYDNDITSTNQMESIDYSSWFLYTNALSAPEGANTLYYYSVDNVGNTESTKSQLIKADAPAPTGSVTINAGAVYTENSSVTLTMFCEDGSGSGCAQMLLSNDNVEWSAEPYTTSRTWSLVPGQGGKTVYAMFKDAAGNSSSVYSASIIIDSMPPVVTITSPVAGFITTATPSLSYTVNTGTVVVKVDGTIVNKVSGDVLDALPDGLHTLRVESTDSLGVSASAEVIFTVDVTAPLVSTIPAFTKVSPGSTHSLAVGVDGSLYAWGSNNNGALGDGTSAPSYYPKKIGSDSTWVSVSAGSSYSFGLKSDGTLWGWGSNAGGYLGDDTTDDKNVPTRIGEDTTWKSISTGGYYTVSLKQDGTLWAWGQNWLGQLGNNSWTASPVPVQIPGRWTSIAAGGGHTLGVMEDGTLWAWGCNDAGQIGDQTTTNSNIPVKVSNDNDWVSVAAGAGTSYALKSNGTIWTWGLKVGPLPNGDSSWINYTPVQVGSDQDWVSIAAGGYHVLLLKLNGTLWAWGKNESGQLGDGSTTGLSAPVQIGTDNTWSFIVARDNYSLALKSDSTAWSWGYNQNGQLGDGTMQNRTKPHQIFGTSDAIMINNGAAYTDNTAVVLNLDAWDITSGVAFMKFSDDGNSWTDPEPYPATRNWTVSADPGMKTVYAMFQDAAGNWSSVYSDTIALDTSPPTVTITSPLAGHTNNNNPLLQYSVNDDISIMSVVVKVDGNTTDKVSGDLLYTLGTGTHTVTVEATDVAGTTTSAQVTFTVDPYGSNVYQYAFADIAVSNNALNTAASEETTIFFTINGPATVAMKIIPEKQGVYGTPVYENSQVCSAAGAYSFVWDGHDKTGKVVPDEAYIYVLTATNGTNTESYRGEEPSGTGNVTCSQDSSYDAYRNDPLSISYTVSRPERVNLSINWSGNVFKVMDSIAHAAGSYTFDWNGRNTDGSMLAGGTATAQCEVASLLRDNVVVTSGDTPNVNLVKTDPYEIQLSYGEFTRIRYTLSRDANVTVKLISPSGSSITVLNSQAQTAGEHEVDWYGIDGSDSYGKKLQITKEGDYAVSITAVNAVTGSSSSVKGSLRIWQ
jgi:alpha-tubulin suppressor-like RCC1 family protein/flagellar hook assembly protein FlgD